jgi:hypothetical protein
MKRLIASFIGAAALACAKHASAQETSTVNAVKRPYEFWQAEVAYRAGFITDPGLNPFSSRDDFDQFTLHASRTIYSSARFSFAPGIVWDVGTSESTARGADTGLTVHRLTVPFEGRYHLASFLYLYGRVAPGAAAMSARVNDVSAPGTLTKSAWLPAIDLSAGGALRFATAGRERFGFWLTGEGGYSWTRSTDLLLSPDLKDDDPRRTDAIDLGHLALKGAFMRVGAAVTF